MAPRSHILDDGGEGVLDTNLTGEREPDRDRGEGVFIIDLNFDPELQGDFDSGLDFDEAGPGSESSLSLGSTDDGLDLDEDASRR